MHSIDVSRGSVNSTVSNQWATRPDDQKFLSLTALHDQVKAWADFSFSEEHKPGELSVVGTKAGDIKLQIGEGEFDFTHFCFQQLAWIAKAPAEYLRRLPAPLAALNLNYGLKATDQDSKAIYMMQNGRTLLRGITGPRYGRIFDHEVASAVMKLAGDGVGDTNWKIPGTIQWGGPGGTSYNPNVDITKQTTTLYASDRDIFIFLVDDEHPIEIGKLGNGEPDLVFRGFYVWNSEVGDKQFGIATMYLRGVCQNRNLWGVEGFTEMTFRHTVNAPEKFMLEAAPALMTYAEGSTDKIIAGVATAKGLIVAKTDDERIEFLGKLGFSEKQAKAMIVIGEIEEGKKPESVWDFSQAITAVARSRPHQEDRIALEKIAGKMLDKVAA